MTPMSERLIMHDAPLFNTLAVIGPGLIGSSILRRAQQTQTLARRLIAIDHSPNVIERVRHLGIADHATSSLINGVKEADFVILCIPTGAVASVAKHIIPHMKASSILSDVASVRHSLAQQIVPHLSRDISFVPAHPMAGTEYSGPDAGFSTLFENRWCLLIPPEGTQPAAITRVEQFWQQCGAKTRQVDEQYHDQICAMVSHLPHLLAFTICDTADRLSSDLRSDVLEYAASGFRDFTRIAASDPIMWRDIFLANQDILLQTLERFQNETNKMAEAIRTNNTEEIIDRIKRGRHIRQGLIANQQN
ncbi:prephenate dehydrogenase/arogenate dehydrogenase family protein [Saccharibacter sp. 17.LH.SD]|uniref:prephenate dehydrogenase/arogenate dehydrogenase family protein n=1 Tax=Saccharibacter sp. 17.LH.SD TaxID=2689393 RepID=UPI00136ACF23|nr:prephenate dehydrogenase/arogenate dehydrogenase family protein [Saccharibacter sp. 17.LH.SD]MXV44202.1 prephenate dehydrogenase/arogenate dehydrogenase family protein [Saccharibacter sp. 17.LH.SD]